MVVEANVKLPGKVTWPQWIAGIGVTLLVTQIGLMAAWSSPYIAQLTSPGSVLPMTMAQASWVVSLLNLGRLFGAIAGALCVNYFGSKTTVLITSIPAALCWVFTIVANTVVWLYVSRFLGGISLGMTYSCFSLYLSEIADPSIRGALVALSMGGLSIGNFIMSVMGVYLSMELSGAVSLALCVILMILFIWLPESPHHLIKKNLEEKAKSSIRWYHRDCDVEAEFVSLQKYIENQPALSFLGTLNELRTPHFKKSLLLITVLFMYSQLCGINNILFYMEIILKTAKVTILQPAVVVSIVMVFGIAGSALSTFLMDRYGRKVLMVSSCIGVTVSLILLSLEYHLLKFAYDPKGVQSISICAMVLFYLTVFIGVLSVPPAVLSEIFPSNVKCVAACFGSCAAGIFSFISAITYLPLLNLMTERYVYLFYGMVLFTAVPFTIFFVPETKGLSLQEIQNRLMKKKTQEK